MNHEEIKTLTLAFLAQGNTIQVVSPSGSYDETCLESQLEWLQYKEVPNDFDTLVDDEDEDDEELDEFDLWPKVDRDTEDYLSGHGEFSIGAKIDFEERLKEKIRVVSGHPADA